jgi:C4-dicarboxylate transporter, DctM subunit
MWLSKVASKLEQFITPVSTAGNVAGGWILLLLMLLTVLNVILRYFFKLPIVGAFELTQFMMALVCLLAFAYATLKKMHVIVTVLTSRFSKKVQEIIGTIGYFVSFALCAIITWRCWVYALKLWNAGEYSGALFVPVYPVVLLLVVGMALFSIVFLKDFSAALAKTLERSRWLDKLRLGAGFGLVTLLIVLFIYGKHLGWQISPINIGLLSIVLLIVILFSGMPIGLVMILIGFLGVAYIRGPTAALDMLGRIPYGTIASYTLSTAPLFMLMGQFAFQAGLSKELYYTVYKWLGNLPGGLAMATVGACAGFGAITGSSLATAATMSTVAYPEMKRYKYHPSLATASLASGGPLAAMIPPSLLFILYAVCTEQSIGKLFIAGILPGIMIAIIFMIAIYIVVRVNPEMGPPGPKTRFGEKIASLKDVWMVASLFLMVIGGIYAGVFTAIEAGGIGAFGALIFALLRRKITWKSFISALLEVGSLTAMLFVIVIGANILGYLLALSRLPFFLADIATGLQVSPYVIIAIIMVVYLILGTFLDSIAMVLLTVPIFYPVAISLGFDPIWFGVMVVLACETGLITPPVGMTVYVVAGVVKDVPSFTIFRGCIPFVIADVIVMIILTAFPIIATFLPSRI